MQVMILLAHPDPGSFNHAISHRAADACRHLGHDVTTHDLHAEGFPALLPASEIPREGGLEPVISSHCAELATADAIVVVHPNWWGMPPAILKGYVDRVFRPGVAYEFEEGDCGEGTPIGLLKATVALVFNTSNTAAQRELDVFGDPLDTLWRNCIFGLCGVPDVRRSIFETVCTSTLTQRKRWLDEVEQVVLEALSE